MPAGDQNPTQGAKGWLAPLRAELLPPLSPGRAPRRARRHLDEPCRLPLRHSSDPRIAMTHGTPQQLGLWQAGSRSDRAAARSGRGMVRRHTGGVASHWNKLINRPDEPMAFRFILQPMMALIAAMHDGI